MRSSICIQEIRVPSNSAILVDPSSLFDCDNDWNGDHNGDGDGNGNGNGNQKMNEINKCNLEILYFYHETNAFNNIFIYIYIYI